MKRHKYSHLELSSITCENEKCSTVNGREGDVRRRIKMNVIGRIPADSTKRILCYPCDQFFKTGKTLREQKIARGKNIQDDTNTMQTST